MTNIVARIGSSIASFDGSIVNAPREPYSELSTHYWPFDGSTGDYSILGDKPFDKYFGVSDVSYGIGKIGEAAYFNGTCSYKSDINISTGDEWSISFWFNDASILAGNVFESTASILEQMHIEINTASQLRVVRWQSGDTDYLYTTTKPEGWNHIVYTYDGSISNVYLNNDHVLVDGPTSVYESAGGGIVFGGPNDPWTGYIDMARYYDYPITTDMVNGLWNNGNGI